MNKLFHFNYKRYNIYYILKIIFHFLYFSISILVSIKSYNLSLNSLFQKNILTRDVFEGAIITVQIYLYYYLTFRTSKHLLTKLNWIIVILLIFSLVAWNKVNQNHFETILTFDLFKLSEFFENLVIYIGFSTILFLILWLLDNIKVIVNNKFWTQKKALEIAESKLLRQQLNPHFLFNAFNSLYSLSLQKHPSTPDTILKLSGMMRYLTDETSVSKVKLLRELKFIEDYIAIEKIRFSNKAKIYYNISGNIENLNIEPLLLISIVENAFKHGFYTNDINNFVKISGIVKNDLFSFTVENSIQKEQYFHDLKREGKGLDILTKRLQLSYPRKHKLRLKNENNIYLAQLEINLTE